MRAVLDACVLYPTVMRMVLLGAAAEGLFAPLWSARILEEWARAARKIGPEGEAQARGEIALTRAAWPGAEQPAATHLEPRLWLPDPADIHVLAVAVAASADVIVTLNAKDFPRGTLADEGVERRDPDGMLYQFWLDHPDVMARVGQDVLTQANRFSGDSWTLRPLLKKARLPRLAKALDT